MRFAAAEWLVLLPFLVIAVARWPRLGLRSPLRVAALALIALALAEPELARGGRGLDLWLLLDRSDSARDLLEPGRAEIELLLERSRPPEGRLVVVDFAADAQRRSDGGEAYSGRGGETRLASALRFALGQTETGRSARLLAVTDGYATEPLTGLEVRLARGVPLDVRLLTHRAGGDYRVESLSLPARVQPLEPVLLELRVSGESDGEVPVTILRDGEPIGTTRARVEGGRAVVRVTDRPRRGGAHRYAAELRAPGDPLPGNDRGGAWVEVVGGPRVLLATAYSPDPLAASLEQQGFEVEVVQDLERLSAGRLAGARVLVLDNVPAYRLPREFLEQVPAWVQVQGGGLLMVGGRWSFGAGGYFESPVDELLPVSMELRREHRRLAVALAIVMDRSGSMQATVPSGQTKMQLANAGAARSLELLGELDMATVFAVDSEAHRVLPLARLGDQRRRAIDAVRRIASAGGGIFVYEGLSAAWRELQKADVGQRHVILFADAADAEEPGDYPALVNEMVEAGATLSVIGLGTPTDTDADLLMGLAALGRGRIFFSADAATLPGLFAQETVAVARSAFLEEPVGVDDRAEWLELAGGPPAGLESVDGYNLSYLREGASAALVSADEYEAPLLAFWRRGGGRAAAVSFPLGGEHSTRVRSWEGYGDLAQTLVRWLMGESLPPGIGLRSEVAGTQLKVDLLFDETWETRLAAAPPAVLLVGGRDQEPRELVWERLAPGHFQASRALEPGEAYRGAVTLGDLRLPFGPVEAAREAEWRFDPERRRELQALSAASGGRELDDLREAWRPVPSQSPLPLRGALVVATLLLFLAEALRTRSGWRWPRLATRTRPARVAPIRAAGDGAPAQAPPPSGAEPQEPDPEGDEAARRARRFDAARWRSGGTRDR